MQLTRLPERLRRSQIQRNMLVHVSIPLFVPYPTQHWTLLSPGHRPLLADISLDRKRSWQCWEYALVPFAARACVACFVHTVAENTVFAALGEHAALDVRRIFNHAVVSEDKGGPHATFHSPVGQSLLEYQPESLAQVLVFWQVPGAPCGGVNTSPICVHTLE
jgi:hypothetical protein